MSVCYRGCGILVDPARYKTAQYPVMLTQGRGRRGKVIEAMNDYAEQPGSGERRRLWLGCYRTPLEWQPSDPDKQHTCKWSRLGNYRTPVEWTARSRPLRHGGYHQTSAAVTARWLQNTAQRRPSRAIEPANTPCDCRWWSRVVLSLYRIYLIKHCPRITPHPMFIANEINATAPNNHCIYVYESRSVLHTFDHHNWTYMYTCKCKRLAANYLFNAQVINSAV